jgi:hypothetical protein
MGPLAEWRMAQETKLSAKAQAAADALAAARAEAVAEIENFYAERKTKSEKRAVVNREAEAAYIQERDATMAKGAWARGKGCGMRGNVGAQRWVSGWRDSGAPGLR